MVTSRRGKHLLKYSGKNRAQQMPKKQKMKRQPLLWYDILRFKAGAIGHKSAVSKASATPLLPPALPPPTSHVAAPVTRSVWYSLPGGQHALGKPNAQARPKGARAANTAAGVLGTEVFVKPPPAVKNPEAFPTWLLSCTTG